MSGELLHTTERQYPFDAQEWFQVDQTAENVWTIREPHHDQDVISYLLNGRDRDILIDSGMGLADINRTIPLTQRRSSKPLTVLLTHTHWDHMGGAADFSDVKVFDNPYETSRIGTGWKPREMPGFDKECFVDIEIPTSFSADTFEISGVPQAETFKDGQIINLGDDMLRIIATPGHTPGSTSFYLESAGFLFTGDTLYVGPLYLHMKDSDYQRFISSIEKLVPLIGRINKVFPAHNDTAITPEKFEELIKLVRGAKAPEFVQSGFDDFNEYTQFEWNMEGMENRKFSLMLPKDTKWPI